MSDYRKIVLEQSEKYLSLIIPGFNGDRFFNCPSCGAEKRASLVKNDSHFRITCSKEGKVIGNIIDLERKKTGSENSAIKKIADALGIECNFQIEEDVLDLYLKNGFDLVPVVRNDKYPIEKDWVNKSHKDIHEWRDWLSQGNNIGVKTGKISNITIIDIDQKPIPPEIEVLIESNCISQETEKGFHLFYQYEDDLPKTRIVEYKIDIENNGGQVVVSPSIVKDKLRTLVNHAPNGMLTKMPEKLKEFLLSKVKNKKPFNFKEEVVDLKEEMEKAEEYSTPEIPDGSRHHFFMRIGGILRKSLNDTQTRNIMEVMNRTICVPPLEGREFNNIMNSLEKYTRFDEHEFASQVYKYLCLIEEGTAKDVMEGLNLTKDKTAVIEKCLKYLMKEGFLFKKRRAYHVIKRAEWKQEWMEEGKVVDFEMPYFSQQVQFRQGDMIIIGAKTGVGKTHIAMNIIKRLMKQGKQPHYISLESGSRFLLVANELGLKEGDFKYCTHFAPEDIEIEEQAITIIDWLLPNDYAQVDKLYKHFAEQLSKKKGVLIIFVQLKESKEQDGAFFAENMIKMFPAFVCKFLYKKNSEGVIDGNEGEFVAVKVRESKGGNKKFFSIGTKYDFKTKELLTYDELAEREATVSGNQEIV